MSPCPTVIILMQLMIVVELINICTDKCLGDRPVQVNTLELLLEILKRRNFAQSGGIWIRANNH